MKEKEGAGKRGGIDRRATLLGALGLTTLTGSAHAEVGGERTPTPEEITAAEFVAKLHEAFKHIPQDTLSYDDAFTPVWDLFDEYLREFGGGALGRNPGSDAELYHYAIRFADKHPVDPRILPLLEKSFRESMMANKGVWAERNPPDVPPEDILPHPQGEIDL